MSLTCGPLLSITPHEGETYGAKETDPSKLTTAGKTGTKQAELAKCPGEGRSQNRHGRPSQTREVGRHARGQGNQGVTYNVFSN